MGLRWAVGEDLFEEFAVWPWDIGQAAGLGGELIAKGSAETFVFFAEFIDDGLEYGVKGLVKFSDGIAEFGDFPGEGVELRGKVAGGLGFLSGGARERKHSGEDTCDRYGGPGGMKTDVFHGVIIASQDGFMTDGT